MLELAKYIVILFGIFLIAVGLLMLFNPEKALATLRKAGSTPFINYTEITLRMLPAAALILSAQLSEYPAFFKLLGWFMIATSFILYFVPPKWHHNYALYSASLLKPLYVRLLSPLSVFFGVFLIISIV